jgi:4-amino-4-deoxy-L-arabinose transferase-like glycosyltransferase
MTDIHPTNQSVQVTAGRSLVSYLLAAGVVCFSLLGQADLTRMEPIIALGGQQMRDSGQWFVPRLYGEVYAFKPALAYWLAATAESSLGRSEFALRVPTALCGLLLGLFIQQTLGRSVSPRCGLTGGLVAITSFLFIEQARVVGFDVPLALGTGTATLAACRNLAAGRSDLRWWLLGYAGLLFAFLAKGLPAVLVYAPGLGLAALLLGQSRMLVRWQHLFGACLFLAGASLYVWLAYREAGVSAWAQHLDEIRSRSSAWTLRAVVATLGKPAVVFAAFLPGSFLTLGLLRRRQWSAVSPICVRLLVAAGAFLAAGVAAFMLAPTTNTRYFLPLGTSISMIASLVTEARASRDRMHDPQPHHGFSNFGRMTPTAWVIVTGLVLWSGYVCGIEPARATRRSLRSVAAALAPHIPAGETLLVDFGDSHSSLIYYLDHPVETRPIDAPPPREPVFVLLADDQADMLAARPGVCLRRLAEQRAATGTTFVLAVASPGGVSEPAAHATAASSALSVREENSAN